MFVHDGPIYHDTISDSFLGLHYNDQLVERYRYLGDKVTFLMRVKPVDPQEASGYSRITATDFGVIEIPNFKSIRSFFKNKPIAKSIIHEAVANHDIIVCRLPSSAGAIAYNEAIRQQKPVLVEVVACVFDALWNYDWRGKLLAHQRYYYYKRLMRKVSFAIYVTEDFLQSRYPTNGISASCSDVELQPQNEDMLQLRLTKIRNRQPAEPLVLGTIAALDVPYKGQVDVIKALGLLKKKGIFFKYKLVGQGNLLAIQKAIKLHDVEDLVQIIGPVPHGDVFSFLQNIDLYIQPSKQEGLPRVIVEAMSTACPCLGSHVGGIPELIDSEALFKPGNVDEIVSKLEAINPKWLQEQAESNFMMAKRYDTTLLDAKREAFYEKFLRLYC
jgi:glycosyltransferase involved in cell wall biosynthesis